ncbi:predicted sugar phosphatases of the HAD superfamily [Phenylobacterium zucineum HLK1]|uniref:Predicted sugar phosphatases of the HAD superfamily n=1 Tax=Phenylobacterium zucineum (strain HLK1) TaxID=450851 RepID=B4RA63_PHEZH|nr:predicted sugar phosphatases of the HAD superfamily [Phenylobacterium zucineum HLK1]
MTSPSPGPLPPPVLAEGLSAIAERYDVLLCDVWGVIHNGREAFPEACRALARFKAERGPVVLISNAPRPNPPVIEQLAGFGVGPEAFSEVVTSGDATRTLLAERAPGPFWKLGPDRDWPLYEGLGLSFTELEQARYIACTGPFDDETETPEDYRERFRAAVAGGLEMICANPDIVVQRGDRLIYCGGALAQLYEALEGRVHMAGKPHQAIYDLALAKAAAHLGRPVDRARVLCIGDGLGTDIRGANAQALDVLFIANGIHGKETVRDGRLDASVVEHLLAIEGLAAAWAMADLVW